jgi:hypothetical protein
MVLIGAGNVRPTLAKSRGTTAQPTKYVLIGNEFWNVVLILFLVPSKNSTDDL